MSYLAFYRKYRPSTFKEVVGQDATIKILRNSIINKSISHAYLFSGPRGTGKTSVAKIFAKSVNCENPIDGEKCNKCTICKAINVNDIDIIEIDAASNNGVDEIREIRNNVKLSPTVGKYKVYIIDEVHMLSIGAFNALLKTLEEPPEHVIFILATTEIQKIPLTIISRCQRYDFKKITPNIITSLLKEIVKKEKRKVDTEILEYIAELSDGGLRDATNLLDQILSNCTENPSIEDIYALNGSISDKVLEQLFDNVIDQNIQESLNSIHSLYESGKNFVSITERLTLLVRDILINNNVKEYFSKIKQEKLEKYSNLKNDKILIISKMFNELLQELKKSTNQKIIFEIKIFEIIEQISDKKEEKIEETKKIEKNDTKNDQKMIKKSSKNEIISREIISIRINNSLAEANKDELKQLKTKSLIFTDYISNKKYNIIANILLKGDIIVASSRNIIFEFADEADVILFFTNIKSIEKFLKEIFESNYSVVAITKDEWQNIKADYVKRKKLGEILEYIEEPILEKSKNNELEKASLAVNIFGEESISIK